VQSSSGLEPSSDLQRCLLNANAALIRWGEEKGIRWAMRHTALGQVFDCRLEIFRTGSVETSDPDRWVTEIAIRIADDPGEA
jgi:hypothetical protein